MSARWPPIRTPAPWPCPRRRATALVVLDAASARVVEAKALRRCAGWRPTPAAFVASTGTGVFVDPTGGRHVVADYVWDNHLRG